MAMGNTSILLPDGWKRVTLGEVSNNTMYGMNAKAVSYDNLHKYIRITDIDESTHRFMPNPLTSPDGEIGEKYKLKVGDIVFARTGASVGKSYLYNENDSNLYFAGFLIKLHIVEQIPEFIYAQTLTRNYQSWVKSISMRSGQPGINAEEYKKLPIVIAPLSEQKAIVSLLEKWDTAIEKTEALIKAKERRFEYLVKNIISTLERDSSTIRIQLGSILQYEQPSLLRADSMISDSFSCSFRFSFRSESI